MGTNGEFKVLFCGEEFPAAEEKTKQFLEDDPQIKVEHVSRADLAEKIGEFDFLVPRMSRLSQNLIEKAKKAKMICQFGVGLEGVDVEAATRAKISVARISGQSNPFNPISCAEHCIYLMLALLRKQPLMALALASRQLGQPIGESLYGKTVLILGYGSIGRQLAVRLKSFGVKIYATRRSWESLTSLSLPPPLSPVSPLSPLSPLPSPSPLTPSEGGAGIGQNADPLLEGWGGPSLQGSFLEVSDIVVLTCPLTPQTMGMVNDDFYGKMKKNAILINIARGGLLDYDSTKKALISGRLGGLGMDVAWNEPLDPTDFVASHERTIVTPHVGGVTDVSYEVMAKIMASTMKQVKNNEVLSFVEVVNDVSN